MELNDTAGKVVKLRKWLVVFEVSVMQLTPDEKLVKAHLVMVTVERLWFSDRLNTGYAEPEKWLVMLSAVKGASEHMEIKMRSYGSRLVKVLDVFISRVCTKLAERFYLKLET